jgi:hypothetical protein
VGLRSAAPVPVGIPINPWVPAAELPGEWTFWAESMLPPYRQLGMVDVSSFYCVKRVSAFGHGNFTVNLPCGLDSQTLINLWSWRLWAFYSGEPYFCGVPTGLQDQNGSAHVQFTMIELPGYLTRRVWDRQDSNAHPPQGGYFLNDEQTYIAKQLAEPVEDVGVVIDAHPGPGKIRTRKYEFLEGGSRGQLLINLANVIDGPEFRTEYRMQANGRPQCVLHIRYPRVGSDSGLGVAVPGAIVNYRFLMDSDQLRTHTFAVGDLPGDAPEGAQRPVAITYIANHPSLPRLDSVDDWPGTILDSTLWERSNTATIINSIPAQEVTGSPPESHPSILTYGPGDTVTVRAVTPLIPEGVEFSARLLQVEVNAATGIANWSAALTSPPQATRTGVNTAITALSRQASQAFHQGAFRPAQQREVRL